MDISTLKNKVIYQVFVRDFTPEGTLRALKERLPYIRSLGVDIIYLMPISPIGVKNRKGTLGSPYSISDYERIDPAIGNEDDLSDFIDAAHEEGMRVMLDVVYNHTSCDSKLLSEHPEYFFHDENGDPANKLGAWSDVYDLDHSKEGLDDYLIDILIRRVRQGIDGFRFDVASLLPSSFYRSLRERLEREGLDAILLAESIDYGFIDYTRSLGYEALSNEELIDSGIDLLYHYGSFQPLRMFFKTRDESYLDQYKTAVNIESASISEKGLVIRNIENHDNPRIASYSDDDSFIHNVLAYSFFTMGPGFLYAGEELRATHQPSLFEKETLDLTIRDSDYLAFVLKLIDLKKRECNTSLISSILDERPGPFLEVTNTYKSGIKEYGLFSFKEGEISVEVNIPDGEYFDLLSEKKVMVRDHTIRLREPLYLIEGSDETR